MKKNIFKKLSLTLALAMVIATVSPAAGAFAAAAPKLNSTKKYLHLDVDKLSDYNFNITNKKSGWNYEWFSANEDIATVDDKNGVVVATGMGTTKITCEITDKKGEAVKDLNATVVVRDNIKTVTITNKPAGDTLAVGVENNFNRDFTTNAGLSKVTSSVTRWTVDKEGATIKDNGVFVATAAGEYTITANSFQSKAKYTTWNADKTANAGLLLATDTYKVTVGVSITGVKLVSANQIAITFDSSVKDTVKAITDVTVNLKLNDTYATMVPVKSFDGISADGKTVTVTTYDALVNKSTYKVAAAKDSYELYVQMGSPVSISMENQTIAAGTSTKVKYVLLDEFGVDVSSAFDASVAKTSTIPWDTTGSLKLGNGVVSFVEFTYLIVNTDGTTKTLTTGLKTVTGANATVGTDLEWNIVDAKDFTKTTKTVALNDTAKSIFGQSKKSDNTYTSYLNYTFVSLSESILMIDANGNKLIPLTAGVALVKVLDKTNSNAFVAYINVEVTAKSATVSVKADKPSVILSNSINGSPESTTVTFKNVDQYAVETAVTIKESYPITANKTTDLAYIGVSGNQVTFTAIAGKSGSFVYFVKTSEDKTITVTVSVAAPGTLSSYGIEANQTSIDGYVANSDTANAVEFTVYGVDSNGTKKELVVPGVVTGQVVTYTVTGPTGFTTQTLTAAPVTGKVTFTVDDIAGTVTVGTYTFTVSVNGIKYAKSFEVKNTRTVVTASINATSTTVATGSSINAAVASMVSLKIGTDVAAITAVEYQSGNSSIVVSNALVTDVNFLTTGEVTIYVSKIHTNAKGVDQTVNINSSFKITVK